MKTSKNRAPIETPAAPAAWAPKWWHYAIGFLAFLFVAFEIYGPALSGPFILDDVYLPFFNPNLVNQPLRIWANVRPLLMATYWVNYQISGIEPYSYHWVSVFLHVLNAMLAFALVRKFLAMAGETSWMREVLSVFAAALFLLHPLQTESVAYVTSRSEVLSILFFFLALAVFLFRRNAAISVPVVILVLALFAMAFLTKEHTAVLPAFLLLTDYFWNPGFKFEGIKRNWKLYIPILAGGVLAVSAVFAVLKRSDSAGFKLQDLQWYQYLFTQFRSIWVYIRLYLFPVGQNVDHDLAISKTIFDHGAIFYMIGLLVLAALAWRFRREYPLASYGYFGFLVLLAPTSSVIPIQDVLVERRAYLPFLCLLLITVEFLRRWKYGRGSLIATLGTVLLIAGALSYQRNELWANPIALWQDTVDKSPNRSRPHFQLAFAQMQAGQCQSAIQQFEMVSKLERPDSRLLVDWALAEDCALKTDSAIARLKQAAQMDPSAHVYSLLGMMYGKQGKIPESLEALATGEKLDPKYEMIFVYRGNDYFTLGEYAKAADEFKRAVAINPLNQGAANGLQLAQKQLRAKQ
jgi:tetratricopeptide (TPR) repeat protein